MELSHENNDKSLILGSVPYWNLGTKYSTNISTKYSTEDTELFAELTELNSKLTFLEKKQIAVELNSLDIKMRKAVLFEAKERIATGTIRSPFGYLLGLIKRARCGDFKPYMINRASQPEQKLKNYPANSRHILSGRSEENSTGRKMSQQEQLKMLEQFRQMLS